MKTPRRPASLSSHRHPPTYRIFDLCLQAALGSPAELVLRLVDAADQARGVARSAGAIDMRNRSPHDLADPLHHLLDAVAGSATAVEHLAASPPQLLAHHPLH